MAPRLSGPATVEESSDLWTGSVRKTAPCEAQCGAYHAGLEPQTNSGSGGASSEVRLGQG